MRQGRCDHGDARHRIASLLAAPNGQKRAHRLGEFRLGKQVDDGKRRFAFHQPATRHPGQIAKIGQLADGRRLRAVPDLTAHGAAQQCKDEAKDQPGRQRQRQRGGNVRAEGFIGHLGHGNLARIGLNVIQLRFKLVQPFDSGLIARIHQIDAEIAPRQLQFVQRPR